MDIYVRTQDKTKLVQTNCVSYEAKTKIKKVVHSDSISEEIIEERHRLTSNGKVLGEYSSKARCFEIMNEIEQKIELEKNYNTTIYNMPEM